MVLGGFLRLFFPSTPFIDTVWAVMGALLFSLFIIYDTFIIMNDLRPDQYCLVSILPPFSIVREKCISYSSVVCFAGMIGCLTLVFGHRQPLHQHPADFRQTRLAQEPRRQRCSVVYSCHLCLVVSFAGFWFPCVHLSPHHRYNTNNFISYSA